MVSRSWTARCWPRSREAPHGLAGHLRQARHRPPPPAVAASRAALQRTIARPSCCCRAPSPLRTVPPNHPPPASPCRCGRRRPHLRGFRLRGSRCRRFGVGERCRCWRPLLAKRGTSRRECFLLRLRPPSHRRVHRKRWREKLKRRRSRQRSLQLPFPPPAAASEIALASSPDPGETKLRLSGLARWQSGCGRPRGRGWAHVPLLCRRRRGLCARFSQAQAPRDVVARWLVGAAGSTARSPLDAGVASPVSWRQPRPWSPCGWGGIGKHVM